MDEDVKTKMKKYGVKAVPITIIDGNIRIIGIPDFPWICGEDLFQKLKRDYSFSKDKNKITGLRLNNTQNKVFDSLY